ALIASSSQRRIVWVALAIVLVPGILGSVLGLGSVASDDQNMLAASVFGFLAAFAVVAHSAHRLNTGFEVHDKAQISAYRHLIEHVQDAVLRFSSEGAVMLASRSSEELFGCPRYQLAGESLSERVHVLDRPNFLTAFSEASKAGRSRTIEL